MIVLAHLAMFAVLFALGLPWLNSTFGAQVAFGGGLIATALFAVAAEAVVIFAALVARSLALALKINPLLQRSKAALIAHAVIFVFFTGFLQAASLALPAVISVSLTWSLLLSGLTVAALDVMLRVKRFLIARS